MNRHKTLKMIHLVSTIWLMLCLALVFVIALKQAGFKWWVIFSLSGHSAVLVFLLVSLYLFAMFGAAGKGHRIAVEHPLTSTSFYMALYVSMPLLGTIAIAPAVLEISQIRQLFGLIAMGTFGATFLTWVIVDPAISFIEMLTPAARVSRQIRLAETKAWEELRQRDRDKQVESVLQNQEQLKRQWEKGLESQAEELAGLLAGSQTGIKYAEQKAVDIGVGAWRMGGLDCMKKLYRMAMERCEANSQNPVAGDYVKSWWDGVGTWRVSTAG